MAMTIDDYTNASIQLLPQGLAWRRTFNGALTPLLGAFSIDYAQIAERAEGLLSEMHPQWSTQLLSEWEELLGLPECNVQGTIEERQNAAGSKWHWHGSLNYRAYELIFSRYGYDIKIIERHPHHCLRSCDYPLWHQDYRWLVDVEIKTNEGLRYWRVNQAVNEYLYRGTDSAAECLLLRYEPAHIQWRFIYKEV